MQSLWGKQNALQVLWKLLIPPFVTRLFLSNIISVHKQRNKSKIPWWNLIVLVIVSLEVTDISTTWGKVIFRVKWRVKIQTNVVMLWSVLWLVVGKVMWLVVRIVSGDWCITIRFESEGEIKVVCSKIKATIFLTSYSTMYVNTHHILRTFARKIFNIDFFLKLLPL